jgi:hypothetical protein
LRINVTHFDQGSTNWHLVIQRSFTYIYLLYRNIFKQIYLHVYTNLMELHKDKRILQLNKILSELETDYGANRSEILGLIDLKIPTNIFQSGLSGLEAISKYLIEEKHLSLSLVARLTGRSKQGIWQAYDFARKKHQGEVAGEPGGVSFPLDIISNREDSVLESIVKYLHDVEGMSFSQIARSLLRDPRTIWTVYNRTKDK